MTSIDGVEVLRNQTVGNKARQHTHNLSYNAICIEHMASAVFLASFTGFTG